MQAEQIRACVSVPVRMCSPTYTRERTARGDPPAFPFRIPASTKHTLRVELEQGFGYLHSVLYPDFSLSSDARFPADSGTPDETPTALLVTSVFPAPFMYRPSASWLRYHGSSLYRASGSGVPSTLAAVGSFGTVEPIERREQVQSDASVGRRSGQITGSRAP